MNILHEPFLLMCVIAVVAFSVGLVTLSVRDALHGRSHGN